jgi:hypothetical protein
VLRHHELPDQHLCHHARNIVSGFRDVGCLLGRQLANVARPRPALALQAVLEAAPNPDSRVTLGERKDRVAMPGVQVDWRLNARDKLDLRRLIATMRAEFTRLKLGSLIENHSEDDTGWPNSMAGGRHHMGTTGMHADERRGVVDPNSRVHGCATCMSRAALCFRREVTRIQRSRSSPLPSDWRTTSNRAFDPPQRDFASRLFFIASGPRHL